MMAVSLKKLIVVQSSNSLIRDMLKTTLQMTRNYLHQNRYKLSGHYNNRNLKIRFTLKKRDKIRDLMYS